MTPEQRALAEQLVQAPAFSFLPGMMLADSMGWSITQEDADGFNQEKALGSLEDTLPDLDDPTTVMSLLVLIKRANPLGYSLQGADTTGFSLSCYRGEEEPPLLIMNHASEWEVLAKTVISLPTPKPNV